jgi:hypothetical protein
MGLNESRLDNLPEHIDEARELIRNTWTIENIMANPNNSSQSSEYMSTLFKTNIMKASSLILEYFKQIQFRPKVLDIMCGNCCASDTIKYFLESSLILDNWISTDIIDYPTRSSTIEFARMDAIESVERFGMNSNVLLLVSPPPASKPSISTGELKIITTETDGHTDYYASADLSQLTLVPKTEAEGYADYYACKDWIDMTKKRDDKITTFIIFIGELGASDGSLGMYKFLMEHNKLKLEVREHLHSPKKDMFGGPIEKELFIFRQDVV